MIRRVASALFLLHAVACTHRGQLSADASELARGQEVAARTISGEEVEGTVVKGPLGGYRVRLERPRRELELSELRTISRESVPRGALDGLLIGAAMGVVAGALLGAGSYDGSSYVVDNRGESALLGAGILGGVGVLVGAAGGAAGGASLEYAVPAQ